MNVAQFQPHFMKTHFALHEKHRLYTKPKNKLSNDFDKLFFNFLIIISYPMHFHYTKKEETAIKYKLGEQLENFKYKHKKDVIHNLCYEDEITLQTLDCLASFYRKNLLYLHMNVYIKMFHDCNEEDEDKKSKIYTVTKNKEIYAYKYQELDDKYEIDNVHKPIYGIGYYKSDTLKTMMQALQLTFDEKDTKTMNYERIRFYLNACLI